MTDYVNLKLTLYTPTSSVTANKIKQRYSSKICDVKEEISNLLNYTAKNLELIYHGEILDNDDATLNDYKVREGGMLQVFHKIQEESDKPLQVTDAETDAAVREYRKIFINSDNGSPFTKALRPCVIKKILQKYPEFYKDLGAYAILNDPVLMERMLIYECNRKAAVSHPILVTAAEFIVKTMNEYLRIVIAMGTSPGNSESSDDGEQNESNESNEEPTNQAEVRRISRSQLAAALSLAGSQISSGTNSSSAAVTTPSTSTAQATNEADFHGFVDAVAATSNASTEDDGHPAYAEEMALMREMGLADDVANRKALIVCNGAVAAAINLVLHWINLGNSD